MSTLNYVESKFRPEDAIHREVIPAGDGWLHRIARGQTLRILDLEGNQAADTLFYNADDLAERYSAQDTIREQGAIYLTTGTQLMSKPRAGPCSRSPPIPAGGTTRSEGPAPPRATWCATPSTSGSCTRAATTFLLQIARSGPPAYEAGSHPQHQLFHERAGYLRKAD